MKKGESLAPEGLDWVMHLIDYRLDEEVPRLGMAILQNLSITNELKKVIFAKVSAASCLAWHVDSVHAFNDFQLR